MFTRIHHIAIICSDYAQSKQFYTRTLGFSILSETYREERTSWKLDLALNGEYILELFSFPDPPPRVSRPEATGLRHLALEVEDLDAACRLLRNDNIEPEPVRTDEITGKRFTFIADPDGLPIELYEK